MEHQTANNLLDMITKILIFLIFSFNLSIFAQENNNSKYYKLYKDGEKVLRPIIYVFNNSTTNLQKLDNGCVTFNIDDQVFKYQPNIHKKDSLTLNVIKKIEFKKVKELFNLEHEEYLRTVKEVMDEKGFKPLPPINHSILKILIISKEKNNFIRYETNWIYSKF
ncbi:hypothetical protein GCM10023311_14190 [Flaviramulus aquimarinus]|uniref:GLPGLI family protein n=1 Tax=Flaviramulus aquimarinus TaxID=1170456 RepID=A0ABP9F297_9FLAO